MNYREGSWHAIVGLDPQYEHMKDSGGTGYDDYMNGYNDYSLTTSSKSEKDFTDGEPVTYRSLASEKVYSGLVDYSYGAEKPGFIRVQEVFSETSDEGNNFYVPIECIQNA